MHEVQPRPIDHPRDLMAPESERQHLAAGDHSVLKARQPRQSHIRSKRAYLGTYTRLNVARLDHSDDADRNLRARQHTGVTTLRRNRICFDARQQ
jgi:hypothetical protein